jgi:hypothetical protein
MVEKAPGWTLEEGFSSAIVDAVDALTRRIDEAEDDFMRRAIANRLARSVKQADLEDKLVQAEQAGLDTELIAATSAPSPALLLAKQALQID